MPNIPDTTWGDESILDYCRDEKKLMRIMLLLPLVILLHWREVWAYIRHGE
jgi:hypothetical protein